MLWIKTVFVRRDAPASRKRVGRIFATGAAVTASLTAPAFAADLAAPPPALTWTGVYRGANASAWFAPASPRYDAIGSYRLSGSCSHYFGTMRGRQTIGLGGGTEQVEAGANQLAGPVA